MSLLKPKALQLGDTIGIAASSSPFERKAFAEGVAWIEAQGFKVYYRDDIFQRQSYLAGEDIRRADELSELLNNDQIRAIFFARGGYGMMRALPFVEEISWPAKPKIVMGYSDITPLLTYLNQKKNWVSFYGPVVAKDLHGNVPEETAKSLIRILTSNESLEEIQWDNSVILRGGQVEGSLVGGCLSLVTSTLGTPYELDTADKILFLEDINEMPYAVDRMLTQLKLAGKFNRVKGVLFGDFINGGDASHYEATIKSIFTDFAGPILSSFPAGHGPIKHSIPLGLQVRLDAEKKSLTFLENACV